LQVFVRLRMRDVVKPSSLSGRCGGPGYCDSWSSCRELSKNGGHVSTVHMRILLVKGYSAASWPRNLCQVVHSLKIIFGTRKPFASNSGVRVADFVMYQDCAALLEVLHGHNLRWTHSMSNPGPVLTSVYVRPNHRKCGRPCVHSVKLESVPNRKTCAVDGT